MNKIKRGVSLYSYQDEFYTGKMTLEDCIREASLSGAKGIEFLPEQMLPTFPNISDDFVKQWHEWMDKYQVEPIAYDAFLDNKLFANRMLTTSENVEMMKRDLKIASRLGCKILRTLVSTPLEVVKQSLDYAEEVGVKIALEVHAPFTFGTPWFEERLDYIKESGTKMVWYYAGLRNFLPNELARFSKIAIFAKVAHQRLSAISAKIMLMVWTKMLLLKKLLRWQMPQKQTRHLQSFAATLFTQIRRSLLTTCPISSIFTENFMISRQTCKKPVFLTWMSSMS